MRRNHPNSTENKDSAEEEEQPTKFDRNNNKMWKGRKKKTTNICSSLHHSCHSRHLISCHLTSPPESLTYIHTYIHNILYYQITSCVFSFIRMCVCRMEYYYRCRLPTSQPALSIPIPYGHSISFQFLPTHPKKYSRLGTTTVTHNVIQITTPTPNHKQDLPCNFRIYDSHKK